jgi:uncharacterized protein YbbC (DUF1343 family)
MKKLMLTWLGLFLFLTQNLNYGKNSVKNSNVIVKPGIDVLLEKQLDLIKGKRIGLITNQTGITSTLKSSVDALNELPDVELVALFGPEHGVRGDIAAGEYVPNFVDKKTGITVYSLYGKTRRPTPEMVKNIEILVYDIQDIGARGYTYIYTMAYAMEAARDAGIQFMVLDRPNPLGGNRVEGNVLDPKFSSFTGLYPIPYLYGMTVGELAKLFNKEFSINCDLVVVPMEGWQRDMTFEDTGLFWVPTSPNIPHAETIFAYASICFIGELGTISEGVGTALPFELLGAPWLDGEKLANELNVKNLPGVFFRPTFFIPFFHPGNYDYVKKQCSGVQIHITDTKTFNPLATQVHILTAIRYLHPEQNFFDTPRIASFDKAAGTDELRKAVLRGDSAEQIMASWQEQLEKFKKIRKKYLIY